MNIVTQLPIPGATVPVTFENVELDQVPALLASVARAYEGVTAPVAKPRGSATPAPNPTQASDAGDGKSLMPGRIKAVVLHMYQNALPPYSAKAAAELVKSHELFSLGDPIHAVRRVFIAGKQYFDSDSAGLKMLSAKGREYAKTLLAESGKEVRDREGEEFLSEPEHDLVG